jgi:ABC-type transporter Mla subunit MlaD
MKRIALILGVLAAAVAGLATSAGADGERTYQAELFNAFGLVEGSELRVAGAKAGTVTDLDVTAEKTALVTFEVGPEFPQLNADASCSSEPQSLIAEYFLDCQPGSSEEPLEEPIAAANNQTTVQQDLVQNTLREPYKRRFQLLINEFGTALAGNPENLNAAIRAGAPALRELREVLQILGRQNTLIAELNANSDAIFAQLADRREDVVRFIDEAEDTARASAERRADLSREFDLLDDFLVELRPTMTDLGNLAREQTPLLTDLYAAAPGLNRLAANLPGFNDATRVSLRSLGRAANVGKRALSKSQDEIQELKRASTKALPAADVVASFLESLDDPRNAVEETQLARDDLRELPGEADRRVALLNKKIGGGLANPGYTGLEGLLNYGYTQTMSLNLFDFIGHALHIQIVGAVPASEGDGECGHFSALSDYPAKGGGRTTNPRDAAYCGAFLGNAQPDINFPLNLPPYDPSVCPDGSADLSLCDPNAASAAARSNRTNGGRAQPLSPKQAEELAEEFEETGGKPRPKELKEILDLKPGQSLQDTLDQLGLGGPTPGATSPSGGSDSTTTGLLDFLFGP